LLNSKLTAKELKRKQQVPWQPKQRAQFSQGSDQTGFTRSPFGRGRGRGGRGRGRVVARNQPWVSGGILTAGDFLGLHAKSAYDGSQFNADDDYSQLAESARSFAAASTNTGGYESYDSYQGYMQGASGQDFSSQAHTQQGQKRGGANSSNTTFTAYGGYTTHTGTSAVQTPSQAAGRGRGLGATRGGGGGGGTSSSAKPLAPAVGSSTTYRPKLGGSTAVGYGSAPQVMQSTARPLMAEQYATAVAPDSYTSVSGQQQQQPQQLYQAYPGYECADASSAYSQTAYYTAAGGQYLATDPGVQQYYSQF